MKSIEVVGFGTLWVILMLLGGLILLLYRQVERAYQGQTGTQVGGLMPGVEAPEIGVLADDGKQEPLRLPGPTEIALLAFVSVGCDSCTQLLNLLSGQKVFKGRAVGLVNGQTPRDYQVLRKKMELRWLFHPPDVTRDYGITATPTVYVLRGRTVLASKVVSTKAGLEGLLADAEHAARALDEEPSSGANGTLLTPVTTT
jgi:hypothetical protein